MIQIFNLICFYLGFFILLIYIIKIIKWIYKYFILKFNITELKEKYGNGWVIITGASSGIGTEFAKLLESYGYDLIITARREDRLVKIARYVSKKYRTNCLIVVKDLSKKDECLAFYEMIKDYDIEVFINNAGFGDFGQFVETDIDKELNMISVNITAVHILMKKMVKYFTDKNEGYLLNVASSAGLMPAGPYMATYYATKSYVVSLTKAVAEELREEKKNVYVGALCPGPVDTEFNSVAGVSFGVDGISAKKCAKIAVDAMFKKKKIIVPGAMLGIGAKFIRLIPEKILLRSISAFQKGKGDV